MTTSIGLATPESKGKKTIDYSGNILHIGIDVHKKRWQVAVICGEVFLGNNSIAVSSEALISHLHRHYPGGRYHCVYECGAWGFTLCRALWAAGMECMVVNPTDISGTDRERRSKTDMIDERRMAIALKSGMLEGVHVPTEKEQKQRSLIRYRKKLWGDLVRAKNRLKSELMFQGISIPLQYDKAHWSQNFFGLVKALRQLLLKTELKLRVMMRSECHKDQMALLQSIPGIGPLTAALFLLEIGDITGWSTYQFSSRSLHTEI